MANEKFLKENVIETLGGGTKAAKFFRCSRQAISQWPDGELIPPGRRYELMVRLPELFEYDDTGAAA